MKEEDLPPSKDDHFFGFSRWTKNCLPYDVENYQYLWAWMDGDCIFQNNQTGELHLIEFKCEKAHVKAYQRRILKRLKEKGVQIHTLRFYYDSKYWGNHDILGDPRYADKLILDDKEVSYETLVRKLLKWHGMPPDLNLKDFLHPKANPEKEKFAEKVEEFC